MVESQIEFIITLKERGMKRAAIRNYIRPVISFCKINDIRLIFHSHEIYLGGVLKGHYNDIIENARGIVRELNSGLGMVTPCCLRREILDGDEAKKTKN